MTIIRTHAVPHPPLIIPSVGQGKQREIQATVDAYWRVADSVAADKPDLILFITPHGKVYADYFHISPGASAEGDLQRFMAPGECFHLTYDEAFIKRLSATAEAEGIKAGTLGGRDSGAIDHGVSVPLYFIREKYSAFKSARLSISGLPLADHYRLGLCIQKTLAELERRAVIIASGDLSHKLTEDGPYGFAPEGPAFDAQVCDIFRGGSFLRLLQMDHSFCEKAAECGLRSFVVMAGALDGRAVAPEFHSYEGPFGVGYALCSFTPGSESESRRLLPLYEQWRAEAMDARRANESPYVKLARHTLETYVKTGRLPTAKENITGTLSEGNAPEGGLSEGNLPEGGLSEGNLHEEMLRNRAGTFVSIKKDGELRGCMGTTQPWRPNIAAEIIGNAVSAGTRDPRFDPVTVDELPYLTYSVDVLSPYEPIETPESLDVTRYGVIVAHGDRQGLLLPNLDGVDTVEQQIAIALKKAGISPAEDYRMFRFEVARHQ